MEGEIRLDLDYHSGVKGNPGTRFCVNLKQPSIDPQYISDFQPPADGDTGETSPTHSYAEEESQRKELPESLSILFTDDDPILRKLFSRSVRTVAPTWKIREASNGETALRLVQNEKFDLIFMDMYMASVEKQMLGTETVKALRNAGVDCRICGLSANDKEAEFLEAGADVFTFKPFPCDARALTQELCRLLYDDETLVTSS
jgi:CheY-like chemotaxis protein